MPWFRHLGKVKMHLRAGPEGKFVRCGLLFFLIGSKYISECTEDIDV